MVAILPNDKKRQVASLGCAIQHRRGLTLSRENVLPSDTEGKCCMRKNDAIVADLVVEFDRFRSRANTRLHLSPFLLLCPDGFEHKSTSSLAEMSKIVCLPSQLPKTQTLNTQLKTTETPFKMNKMIN